MQILRQMRSFRSEATDGGFTLIEVLVAGGIMIILCIGTLTVFSHAVQINSGNNFRAQAESVLGLEVECIRSLRFTEYGADPALNAVGYPHLRTTRTSADGTVFNLSVGITNLPLLDGTASDDSTATMKEIRLTATAVNPRQGWLSDTNLHTDITFQRTRGN